MKHYFRDLKQTLIIFLSVLFFTSINSQNSEQARFFINRSHIAVAKVQKEMYKSGKKEYDAEIKKAIKYQVIAIQLHKENKFKEAVGYSFKSRSQCMELCNKMGISEGAFYALNDDEKVYCNPNDFTGMNVNPALLNASESQKIEDLDILNVQKFREINLNIK
jgi:hypothetical protein